MTGLRAQWQDISQEKVLNRRAEFRKTDSTCNNVMELQCPTKLHQM